MAVSWGGGTVGWAGGGGSGGGAGTPGGSNTHVQFNDSGAFGGQNSFTYTKAVGALTLTPLADATVLTARAFTAGTAPIAQFQNSTGGNQITIGPAGTVATGAGVNLALTATAPAATTGASQAGKSVTITASPAVASTDTAGAAAGGSVTITAGAAARNTSGDANGGNIYLDVGAKIGNGNVGVVTLGGPSLDYANVIESSPGGYFYIKTRTAVGAVSDNAQFRVHSGTFGSSDTVFAGVGKLQVGSAGEFSFAPTTYVPDTGDIRLRRRDAANPAWGAASATPVAYTHNLAADARGGTDTNTAGANATLLPGVGTGTGAASRLLLGGPLLGTTGSVAQTTATPVSIGGEVKADGTESFLNVTGTLPSAPSAEVRGVTIAITGAGSAAQSQTGVWLDHNAGYTGANVSRGLYVDFASASTATQWYTGNVGVYGVATNAGNGATAGAVMGAAATGTGRSAGGVFYADATSGTGSKVGVIGLTTNGTTGTARVGGAFYGYIGGTAYPPVVSAALLADNMADAVPIFVGRDNSTTVFSVNDGGGVNMMREVEQNSTAIVGTPNVLTATESNSVMTNEGATALNVHLLPTAAKGLTFTFVVQDGDGIRIAANTDDTIRVGGNVTAAAGYIESTTIGSSVTLLAISAVEWVAISVVGTWTI